MLRLLIEALKVYLKPAELKLLFLEPVQIPIDFRRSKRATTPLPPAAEGKAHP